jgi:hypothetical protein
MKPESLFSAAGLQGSSPVLGVAIQGFICMVFLGLVMEIINV